MTDVKICDNLVVGAGAAGIAVAKLLSLSQKEEINILIEQHAEPGGCAGYFSRGNPRRTHDAGATQLILVEEGQLQDQLLQLGLEAREDFPKERIENLEFHFPEDQTDILLDKEGRIHVFQGNLEQKEKKVLERIFRVSSYLAKPIWNVMEEIPKFPFYSWNELIHNIKIAFKLPIYILFFFLFGLFFSSDLFFYCLGLRDAHKKSKKIINSLLLDTSQNTMDKIPAVIGIMGLSILSVGIFRYQQGMRSYFKKLSAQISKNGLSVFYQQELQSFSFKKEGIFCTLKDKKSNQNYSILVRKNLFLNATVWNAKEIFFSLPDRDFFSKIHRQCVQSSSWGACAIYGYFENLPNIPQGPWYHQIFQNTQDLIPHSVYLSVYQKETGSSLRSFTASIHIELSLFSEEKRTDFHEEIKKRIEQALKIKILNSEFASPKTFEHYTKRKNGRVGGIIMDGINFILHPTPAYCSLGKQNIHMIGDTVFPGQGVVSCTMSGINAWERATGLQYSKWSKIRLPKN